MKRILSLTSALAGAHTAEEVANIMVRQGVETLSAATGVFARLRSGGVLEVVAHFGIPPRIVDEFRLIPIDAALPIATACRTREPEWVENASEYDRRYTELGRRLGRATSAVAALPLVVNGKVVAAVAFRFDVDRTFDGEERSVITALASQAAQAYQRAQLQARDAEIRRRLEALRDLAEGLSKASTRAEVVDVVLDLGMKIAGADTCTLHSYDESAQELRLIGDRGASPDILERIRRIDAQSQNPVYGTLQTRQTLWAENEHDYTTLFPALADRAAVKARARAFWCVPLVAEAKPIGLLGMGFYEPRRFSGEERDFVHTFTRYCAEALRRAERLETERAARSAAERKERLLAKVAATLADPLDYEATLARLVELAVPELADWCAVDVPEEGKRTLRRLAVAHVDPARAEFAREFAHKYPAAIDDPSGPPAVLRTGRSEIYERLTDEMLAASATDEEYLRILRELHLRSVMIVPLTAREKVLGAMTFVYAGGERHYSREDLAFAETLGQRCGIAMDNARLYAAEKRAREIADLASQAKDEFLATLSHELRTPLTAIMGWAKLLTAPGADEQRKARALETIERNANAMAELIDDLLDMSRIVSGRLRIEQLTVDLANVVEAAVESIRPAAEAKRIRIAPLLDLDVGRLKADPVRLQQVVWNLLSNATKFTPEGGRIEVVLRRVGSSAEIGVSDTGIGIDAAFLPFVFDPFRQQDASSTRSRGGLGLGLAITHRLVELHGGQIQARSEGEGRGASFLVRLPLSSPEEWERRDERNAVPAPEPAPARRLEHVRVLVVDDQADARTLVQAVLEEAGADVVTAGDVASALECFARRPPDLLISDLGMPGRDGYDLIRAVRALSPHQGGEVPAAAVSAYARTEDRRRSLNAGYSMHLAKPIDPRELVDVVASLIKFVPGRLA